MPCSLVDPGSGAAAAAAYDHTRRIHNSQSTHVERGEQRWACGARMRAPGWHRRRPDDEWSPSALHSLYTACHATLFQPIDGQRLHHCATMPNVFCRVFSAARRACDEPTGIPHGPRPPKLVSVRNPQTQSRSERAVDGWARAPCKIRATESRQLRKVRDIQ